LKEVQETRRWNK